MTTRRHRAGCGIAATAARRPDSRQKRAASAAAISPIRNWSPPSTRRSRWTATARHRRARHGQDDAGMVDRVANWASDRCSSSIPAATIRRATRCTTSTTCCASTTRRRATRAPSNLESYIRWQALGEAIRSPNQRVVLIDEIDKAPRDFPNDLLDELDRMEFHVPELCLELHRPRIGRSSSSPATANVSFPIRFCDAAFFTASTSRPANGCRQFCASGSDISTSLIELDRSRRRRASNSSVRSPGSRKMPSTAELIAWVRVLQAAGVDPEAARRKAGWPSCRSQARSSSPKRTPRSSRGQMTDLAMPRFCPSTAFLEVLRAKGYGVSLHEHDGAWRVLLEHWDRTNVMEFGDALAALVGRSEDEVLGIRHLFADIYLRPPLPPQPLAAAPVPISTARWAWSLAAGAAAMVLAATLSSYRHAPAPTPPPAAPPG